MRCDHISHLDVVYIVVEPNTTATENGPEGACQLWRFYIDCKKVRHSLLNEMTRLVSNVRLFFVS